MSDFPSVRFRDYAGLVAAMRAVKDHIGLSNAELESICGLTSGHVDKALGPASVKTIGRSTFDLLCGGLAVEFSIHVDIEAARRMESRWEKRNRSQILVDARPPSMEILERAIPVIARQNGIRGALARMTKLSPMKRSKIAKRAARVRWRRVRAQAVAAE